MCKPSNFLDDRNINLRNKKENAPGTPNLVGQQSEQLWSERTSGFKYLSVCDRWDENPAPAHFLFSQPLKSAILDANLMEKPRFVGASYEGAKCPCCWEPLGDLWQLSGSPKLPYHPDCAKEMNEGTQKASPLEDTVRESKPITQVRHLTVDEHYDSIHRPLSDSELEQLSKIKCPCKEHSPEKYGIVESTAVKNAVSQPNGKSLEDIFGMSGGGAMITSFAAGIYQGLFHPHQAGGVYEFLLTFGLASSFGALISGGFRLNGYRSIRGPSNTPFDVAKDATAYGIWASIFYGIGHLLAV